MSGGRRSPYTATPPPQSVGQTPHDDDFSTPIRSRTPSAQHISTGKSHIPAHLIQDPKLKKLNLTLPQQPTPSPSGHVSIGVSHVPAHLIPDPKLKTLGIDRSLVPQSRECPTPPAKGSSTPTRRPSSSQIPPNVAHVPRHLISDASFYADFVTDQAPIPRAPDYPTPPPSVSNLFTGFSHVPLHLLHDSTLKSMGIDPATVPKPPNSQTPSRSGSSSSLNTRALPFTPARPPAQQSPRTHISLGNSHVPLHLLHDSTLQSMGIDPATVPQPPNYPTPPRSGSSSSLNTRALPFTPARSPGQQSPRPSTPTGRPVLRAESIDPPADWLANLPRKLSGLDHFAKKLQDQKKRPRSAMIREDSQRRPLPEDQQVTQRPLPVEHANLFQFNIDSMKSILNQAKSQDRIAAIESLNRLPFFAKACSDIYNQCVIQTDWNRHFYKQADYIQTCVEKGKARGWPMLDNMFDRLNEAIVFMDDMVKDWVDTAAAEILEDRVDTAAAEVLDFRGLSG